MFGSFYYPQADNGAALASFIPWPNNRQHLVIAPPFCKGAFEAFLFSFFLSVYLRWAVSHCKLSLSRTWCGLVYLFVINQRGAHAAQQFNGTPLRKEINSLEDLFLWPVILRDPSEKLRIF